MTYLSPSTPTPVSRFTHPCTLFELFAPADLLLLNSIAMGVDIETMKDGDNATFPSKGQKVTFFIYTRYGL